MSTKVFFLIIFCYTKNIFPKKIFSFYFSKQTSEDSIRLLIKDKDIFFFTDTGIYHIDKESNESNQILTPITNFTDDFKTNSLTSDLFKIKENEYIFINTKYEKILKFTNEFNVISKEPLNFISTTKITGLQTYSLPKRDSIVFIKTYFQSNDNYSGFTKEIYSISSNSRTDGSCLGLSKPNIKITLKPACIPRAKSRHTPFCFYVIDDETNDIYLSIDSCSVIKQKIMKNDAKIKDIKAAFSGNHYYWLFVLNEDNDHTLKAYCGEIEEKNSFIWTPIEKNYKAITNILHISNPIVLKNHSILFIINSTILSIFYIYKDLQILTPLNPISPDISNLVLLLNIENISELHMLYQLKSDEDKYYFLSYQPNMCKNIIKKTPSDKYLLQDLINSDQLIEEENLFIYILDYSQVSQVSYDGKEFTDIPKNPVYIKGFSLNTNFSELVFLIEYKLKESVYLPSSPCRISYKSFQCQNETSIYFSEKICFDLKDNVKTKYIDKTYFYFDIFVPFINKTILMKYFSQFDRVAKYFYYKNSEKDRIIAYLKITGSDFTYHYFESSTKIQPLSAGNINLRKCKDNLVSSINNKNFITNIYITTLEIIHNDSLINQIEYLLTDVYNHTLDTSLCAEKEIEISYSLNFENFSDYYSFYEFLMAKNSIDFFNTGDKFYNDICFPFTSLKSKKDMTLKDRRKIYYPNIPLCENNCTYIAINTTTNRSLCSCIPKTSVLLNRSLSQSVNFTSALPKTNLGIIKCLKEATKISAVKTNIGLYLAISISLTVITLLIFYYCTGIDKINFVVNKVIRNNKPMKVIHFYPNKCNSKNMFQINSLSNSRVSIVNGSLIIDSSQYNFNRSIISNESKESNSVKKVPQQQPVTILKTEPFRIKNYWSVLLVHHPVINLFFNKKDLTPYTLKITYFLHRLFLIFTLNAMLFTQATISKIYYSEKNFIISAYIPNCFCSLIIYVPIIYIFRIFYCPFRKIGQMLELKEIPSKKTFNLMINKAHNKVKLYTLLIIVFMSFYFYYITIFCSIYRNSQISWIISSTITIGILLIFYFISGLFIYFVYGISIKFEESFLIKCANVII